ncbi:MAG: efflux RND transporter permease subunit [Gammaproteobacteria bacterium]|nr:efflux RND transporter permease subunit [Gammaproteobacteria bacterium]
MNWTDFFIRRPAFTIVFILIIFIIGLLSYSSLPVRWIPSVRPNVISIYTGYPGASASLIESQITTPIETYLSGIDGVDSLTSNSRQGTSDVTLNFKQGRNIDAAVEDVRGSLARMSGVLPKDAGSPIVSRADADDMPILFLAFSNPAQTEKQVSDYAEQFIVPRLQTIEGVATVMTYGRRASVLRIELDPAKMAASHITVDDISDVLMSQNIQMPSGQIRTSDRFYNVVMNETLNSIDEFNNLILRNDKSQVVRLKNVADIKIAPMDIDSSFRVQGQTAMALGIIPQSTANPLDVSADVLKTFDEIKKSLPAGMHASVVYNQSNFIRSSVHSVYEALFESIICVLAVIYLFLASWRATLIPVITIPVCIVSTFALLHLFHFSINTITLMAFVLAIGLVVDDAIVMLENISRHIEDGMKPFAAALKGSREMIFPIIAMTLTLAAVYTPIAFTSGILSSVLSEFALTLAGSVLISGVVALTLSPMMCSRILVQQSESQYSVWVKRILNRLQFQYEQILFFLLKKRNYILILLACVAVLGYGLFRLLPSELAPSEDRDEVNVYVSAPHDASFQYTDRYVKQLEKMYAELPDVSTFLAGVGEGSPSFSYQILTLKPLSQRHHSAQDIADSLSEKIGDIPGVNVSVSVPPSPLTWFSGSQGDSVGLAVMSVGEYKDLHTVMQQLVQALKKYPQFSHVDSRLKWDRNQFEVNIDREKISDLHISLPSITNTISTFIAGRSAGKFQFGGKQYDIILQMNQSALANPNIIPQLYVRSTDNNIISLGDFVEIHETTNPGSLPHYDRLRSDTLSASLAPGYTIKDAVAVLETVTQKILPDNMKIAFLGEAKSYLESSHKMALTFLLAIIFIYLVLVAQFESFVDPFIILLTVPFAVIGALFALKMMGGTLNIYSNIGLVTLIGLIAKHGILITEFANKFRDEGLTIHQAIVSAAVLRLRPILMTTAAMVLGALPLALAFGPGAETRQQIGWVIVGGLIIGTFFSLIVIPVAYTYLACRPGQAASTAFDHITDLSRRGDTGALFFLFFQIFKKKI